jgi:hypothetical protein
VLEADFGPSISVLIARYLVLICVIAAAPMAILPAKYAFEQVISPRQPLSAPKNVILSLSFTLVCYLCAVFMPNLGFIITLTGATVNPFIGFIFPIIFYLSL